MKDWVVLDASVLVAALQSTTGASALLIRSLEESLFEAVLSVPLCLEYEEVLSRFVRRRRISDAGKERILNFMCAHARLVEVQFRWRPFLDDSDDEMVLETAVAGGVDIVTFNVSDFENGRSLGVRTLRPVDMLRRLKVIP